MKKLILCIWLIFSFNVLFAQWEVVFDDPDYMFGGVAFLNNDTGFVAGKYLSDLNGRILKTTDGGTTWTIVHQTISGQVEPICFSFVDESLMYSGGEDGSIFKSVDGGENWSYISSTGYYNNIFHLVFLSPDTGISPYKRTVDGGYTWEPTGLSKITDSHFYDGSSGLVTTISGIYMTNNSGESWIKVDPEQDESFVSISMANDTIGYASSENKKLYKTNDGGSNWVLSDSIHTNNDILTKVKFKDENNGFLLIPGRMLKTTNGGENWDYVLFDDSYSYDFSLTTNSTIFLPTVEGKIYKNSNGGGNALYPDYTSVHWTSKIWKPDSYWLSVEDAKTDSSDHLYLTGYFFDTLKVDNTIILPSNVSDKRSAFILKYPASGGTPWHKVIEKEGHDIIPMAIEIDQNSNVLLAFKESSWNNIHLHKISIYGDSLWTLSGDCSGSIGEVRLSSDGEGNSLMVGAFNGMLTFDDFSVSTENSGVFLLKTDSLGNPKSISLVVEFLHFATSINFQRNQNGTMCFSMRSNGPAYINSDSLGYSINHIICYDDQVNLLWYNNDYNGENKLLSSFTLLDNNQVLTIGREDKENKNEVVIYHFNETGGLINSQYISGGSFFGGGRILITKSNQILVVGGFLNQSVCVEDTLYGFGSTNLFYYSFDENLDLLKSSQVSGAGIILNFLEQQNNVYITGRLFDDVCFNNDTVHCINPPNSFIAKLNHQSTSVTARNQPKDQLVVYPNPSSGTFNIILPGFTGNEFQLDIHSITGKKISEITLTKNNPSFDLSQYQKGIYFIQAKAGKKIYCTKVILQ